MLLLGDLGDDFLCDEAREIHRMDYDR